MRNMLKTIKNKLERGEALVLVTVIASSGATPRGAGARMLIGKEGRLCGTIGGGAVEYRSEQIAAKVLEEKTSLGQCEVMTKGGLFLQYFRRNLLAAVFHGTAADGAADAALFADEHPGTGTPGSCTGGGNDGNQYQRLPMFQLVFYGFQHIPHL